MIYILKMGEIKKDYFEKVKIYVEEVYRDEVNIIEMDFPDFCFDKKRNQYDASCLLKFIPLKEGEIIGVCDKDLYVKGFNFVFGIAEFSGKRGVVSIKRLKESFYLKDENEDLLIIRMAKEIIHELGHLKGLEHCENKECVMAFSNSIFDTDYKDYKMCEKCKRRIL